MSLKIDHEELVPRKFSNISTARVNLTDDDRPYLYVKTFEQKFRGLLDSGAQATVIGLKMYESMKEAGLPFVLFSD